MMVEIKEGLFYRAEDIRKIGSYDSRVGDSQIIFTMDNGDINMIDYDNVEDRDFWLKSIIKSINNN